MKQVALITGGSSGIGLEYARQLAAKGYALALVSNREEDLAVAARELGEVEKVAGEASACETVHTLCVDLARHGAAREVVDWCDTEGLEPEILVNNAGMFFMEYLGTENVGKADAMMTLHMETVTDLCILLGARMKERGHGYILNMASMTAWIPAPGIAIYSASKAYLVSFGKGLSYELRPYGVRVTTVCPAAVDTGLYPLGDKLRGRLRRLGIIRSPQWLVRRSLRAMFRGRRLLRPGPMNHLVPAIVGILPSRLIDRLGMKWIHG